MENNLSFGQKSLLFILYSLLILMVIFSIGAMKNTDKSGYDNCIQKKCIAKGEDFCQKFREVNNCCLGAGGHVAQSNNGYICVFE
ncbi:hypothetical protein HOA91_03450 [Candidatus Woesearchaeota archaeon]|jgi:hypothetical protein|nr:hypothetical protein [Candidatus Woesearchaeota archaeon]